MVGLAYATVLTRDPAVDAGVFGKGEDIGGELALIPPEWVERLAQFASFM